MNRSTEKNKSNICELCTSGQSPYFVIQTKTKKDICKNNLDFKKLILIELRNQRPSVSNSKLLEETTKWVENFDFSGLRKNGAIEFFFRVHHRPWNLFVIMFQIDRNIFAVL